MIMVMFCVSLFFLAVSFLGTIHKDYKGNGLTCVLILAITCIMAVFVDIKQSDWAPIQVNYYLVSSEPEPNEVNLSF